MRWYADYRHSMHGMLVLDEQGQDRLAIGDSTPDPNIGKRIGASTGIVVNDAQGFERTGYGMLTVAGKDRVVLGHDGKDGEEAVVLSVHDDGVAGLSVRGVSRRSIFLGLSPAIAAPGVKDSAGATSRRIASRRTMRDGRSETVCGTRLVGTGSLALVCMPSWHQWRGAVSREAVQRSEWWTVAPCALARRVAPERRAASGRRAARVGPLAEPMAWRSHASISGGSA